MVSGLSSSSSTITEGESEGQGQDSHMKGEDGPDKETDNAALVEVAMAITAKATAGLHQQVAEMKRSQQAMEKDLLKQQSDMQKNATTKTKEQVAMVAKKKTPSQVSHSKKRATKEQDKKVKKGFQCTRFLCLLPPLF